jgi:hypothetical protein
MKHPYHLFAGGLFLVLALACLAALMVACRPAVTRSDDGPASRWVFSYLGQWSVRWRAYGAPLYDIQEASFATC